MATSGQLCAVISRLLGLPEPTVRLHFLNLAKAGLRTTGGRGRSAARMVAKDAANLIVAAVASPAIKDTVESLMRYTELRPTGGILKISQEYQVVASEKLEKQWDLRFMPVPQLAALPLNHSFMDAFTALIEAVVSGDIKLAEHEEHEIRVTHWPHRSPSVHLEVNIITPDPFGRIKIGTKDFDEIHSYSNENRSNAVIDLESRFTITDRTIYAVSKCLRDEPLAKIPKRGKRLQS